MSTKEDFQKLTLALTYPQEPPPLEKTHLFFTVPQSVFGEICPEEEKITALHLYYHKEGIGCLNRGLLRINVLSVAGQKLFAGCIDILRKCNLIIPVLVERDVTVVDILTKFFETNDYRQTYIYIPAQDFRQDFNKIKDILSSL